MEVQLQDRPNHPFPSDPELIRSIAVPIYKGGPSLSCSITKKQFRKASLLFFDTSEYLLILRTQLTATMGGMPSKPVPPSLTDKNLADLFGKVGQSLNRIVVDQYLIITKVFLITGATSGIGAELAKILYAKNATVWIAARSRTKIEATIKTITNAHPTSRGVLKSITVDFNDMTTIKPAVNTFLANASRLDVLWNNAGIMIPPAGTVTRQGYEAQLGVNALAHFLFTKLLTPILLKTAELSPKNSTRIVWVSSSAAANFAPPGGVDMSNLGYQKDRGQWYKYGTSKAAAILYASEFANRHNGSGVISLVSSVQEPRDCVMAKTNHMIVGRPWKSGY
jgi:NAD(P)-dependent dehydrogenase (short-subunit alcohol dehydrogenase family)